MIPRHAYGIGAALLLALICSASPEPARASGRPAQAAAPTPRVLKGHEREILALAFSPDGKTLATCSEKKVRLWETESGILARTLTPPKEEAWGTTFSSLAFSPDGTRIAANGALRGAIGETERGATHWDAATGERLANFWTDRSPGPVDFNPSGRIFYFGLFDGPIQLWSVAQEKQLATLEGAGSGLDVIAVSPDGVWIAASSGSDLLARDPAIRLWNLADKEEPRKLEGHEWAVYDMAFSPDGSILASAGPKPRIVLWNPEDGEALAALHEGKEAVWSLAFHPDGRHLIAGNGNGKLQVWDVKARKKLSEIRAGQRDRKLHVAVSPSGKLVATGGPDRLVRLWKFGELLPAPR